MSQLGRIDLRKSLPGGEHPRPGWQRSWTAFAAGSLAGRPEIPPPLPWKLSVWKLRTWRCASRSVAWPVGPRRRVAARRTRRSASRAGRRGAPRLSRGRLRTDRLRTGGPRRGWFVLIGSQSGRLQGWRANQDKNQNGKRQPPAHRSPLHRPIACRNGCHALGPFANLPVVRTAVEKQSSDGAISLNSLLVRRGCQIAAATPRRPQRVSARPSAGATRRPDATGKSPLSNPRADQRAEKARQTGESLTKEMGRRTRFPYVSVC